MSLELTLVRHGCVEGRSRVFRGRTDCPLSAAGVQQMDAVCDQLRVRRPDIILASPMQRCREPALAMAERLAVPVRIVPDLREIDFGEWEELSPAEAAVRWPREAAELYSEPDTVTPPGGESFREFRERVVGALGRLLAEYASGHVVAVTHAGVIRVMLAHLLALETKQAMGFELQPASCCVLLIEPDGSTMLHALMQPARNGA
jgi:broad specificity phosphatase PhoE